MCCLDYLLSGNLTTNPFTLWSGTVRIPQGVHDDVHHPLGLDLIGDISVLVNDEEQIHKVTARANVLCVIHDVSVNTGQEYPSMVLAFTEQRICQGR